MTRYHLDSQNRNVIARRAKPDVAIPRTFRELSGIATPVCALVRDDSMILPQNAITGAPGAVYLSTARLRDHVHQIIPYPLLTNRGSLNGCFWLLFSSLPFTVYEGIIPKMGRFVNRKLSFD